MAKPGSFPHLFYSFSKSARKPVSAGVSFEAGGRAFHPVVSHSMSGTLMPIFERFCLIFLFLYIFLVTFYRKFE